MSIPALIPGTTSEANRFKRPWKDSSRTPMVPLIDVDGQAFEGRIVVPVSMMKRTSNGDFIAPDEHTNERHRFNHHMLENLQRWAEWRQRRGWVMASKPKIRGPYLPAEGNRLDSYRYMARAKQVIGEGKDIHEVTDWDEPEEVRWYFVTARFKRSEPVFVKLEDALYLNHLKDIYSRPEPKDSGWVNPLVHAEQRRQRLGLKRKDYLLGPITRPL